MSTRTMEECRALAASWAKGEHDRVIEALGGEPTERFLSDFSAPDVGLSHLGPPETPPIATEQLRERLEPVKKAQPPAASKKPVAGKSADKPKA